MERNEDAPPELVWAKFSRYPWWPAFLTGLKSDEGVEVQFFGTFEVSVVKDGCVRPFGGAPPLEAKDLRSKRLQAAIESAVTVQEGATTIAEEKEKVAKGRWASNPARLPRILARLAEQIQAESGADLPKFESLEDFSPSESGPSPCQSCQKIETFDALQRRIQTTYEKLTACGDDFATDFEKFIATVKEALEERFMRELLGSQIGRWLVQLKSQIQNSGLNKELRRRALYDITTLLTCMKRKIIDYFFMTSEAGEPLPQELAATLTDKILELAAVKPDEKLPRLFSASPQRTSSHRNTQKAPPAAEAEQFKEKFKIPLEVKNRVLKKFSKFLLQYSDEKLCKAEAEKLAKLIHEQICAQSDTLNEYKRAVVAFVHKRAELCDFFRFKCPGGVEAAHDTSWDGLLQLLFR